MATPAGEEAKNALIGGFRAIGNSWFKMVEMLTDDRPGLIKALHDTITSNKVIEEQVAPEDRAKDRVDASDIVSAADEKADWGLGGPKIGN